ncbi:hypothetical protein BGZ60DRAFT_383316 [Tricladium varicosporioides]|nr:hypothetical protein BGZ60DRAFT_383316 [Hymenoscyphus varicosporioides]
MQLQNIEDFEKEQAEKDASRDKEAPAKSLPKQKKQRVIDVNAIAAEAKALEEIGRINWIGKLNEYRAIKPLKDGLTFDSVEASQNPVRFKTIVTIKESDQTFGEDVSFSVKKESKHYAAKKAIDWLIMNKFMPSDGTVKFPKPLLPHVPISKENKPPTFASQIPDLCARLGFDCPKYEINKSAPHVESLYDGYAHFNGDPRIEGRVGECKNVYGKHKCKETIAEEVLTFLKNIEKHRSEMYQAEDKKRKRGFDETTHGTVPTQATEGMKREKPAKPTAADFFDKSTE